MGVLMGVPSATAQSFKSRLKNVAKKVEQKVTPKELTKDVTKDVSKQKTKKEKSGNIDLGSVNASVPLIPKDCAALFAPEGATLHASYGSKSVTVKRPPKDETKQPDWNDSRPFAEDLDNKSLVN